VAPGKGKTGRHSGAVKAECGVRSGGADADAGREMEDFGVCKEGLSFRGMVMVGVAEATGWRSGEPLSLAVGFMTEC
jgi:hypothetical protein